MFANPNQPAVFDVAVIGRGPIGAAAALVAERRGLSVVCVGPQPVSQVSRAEDQANWDTRVYALSAVSRQLLSELRVWDAMVSERIAPVYDMRVHPAPAAARRFPSAGELHFSAYEGQVPALAWIVEGSNLNTAFARALEFSRVQISSGTLTALQTHDNADSPARLTLADGATFAARLVVGADGAESVTRKLAGLATSVRPYPQTAVVANFACSLPHADCAWQWFGPHGVLALLPLPGDRCSMVWSAPHALAADLQRFEPDVLAAEVHKVAGDTLGTLTALGQTAAFELRRIDVPSIIAPRLLLAGDAAHVIHPLAGQGMNLGFADVVAFAAMLDSRETFRDLGDHLLLRRYERSRREAVAAMATATEGLQRLFDADALAGLGPLATPLTLGRDLGWGLVSQSGFIKRQLMGLASA